MSLVVQGRHTALTTALLTLYIHHSSSLHGNGPFSSGVKSELLNREITWKHACFSVYVYMKAQ